MKRIGNLYHKIWDINNLRLAELNAKKGKKNKREIIEFNKNREQNLLDLQLMLRLGKYNTSQYITFKINDGKERIISKLPYRDRIVHHALINIINPIIIPTLTHDTYSCIKGRGLHLALRKLKIALKDRLNASYCLQLDIKKCFPSVNNDVLKSLIRKKIKCHKTLNLIDNIINSASGLPIGNLTSQLFGNFYLNYFDHWLKQDKKVKYMYRYCDDVVILSGSKEFLNNLVKDIQVYLADNLKLSIKYRIFPVKTGIDFLGQVNYPTHSMLRKRIKKRFLKMMKYRRNDKSISAYNGMLIHTNSLHLRKKINQIIIN